MSPAVQTKNEGQRTKDCGYADVKTALDDRVSLARSVHCGLRDSRPDSPAERDRQVSWNRSVFLNPNDRRSPWAEAPSAESCPLTLDVRGASVTQLNGGFG